MKTRRATITLASATMVGASSPAAVADYDAPRTTR